MYKSLRRMCACALLALCALAALFPCAASAEYDGEIQSNCAILTDASSGAVLFEKNADLQVSPASTTKIMTCLVVLERVADLEETATVGSEVWRFSEKNTLIGLTDNEEVRVIDLLYGMMLPSGNDAAAVLACHVGGSIDGFAELMNAKARELGMVNTHFADPHGLARDNHYTTASDMAKLAAAAAKNEVFMEIVGTYSYTMPPTNKRSSEKTVTNTHRFIKPDTGWDAVTGMKTGSTSTAKGCLVTSAEQDGKKLICVILGDPTDGYEARWSETRSLLEYGFANLSAMSLSALTLPPVDVQIAGYGRNDAEAGLLVLDYDTTGVTLSGLTDYLSELKRNASQIQVNVTIDEAMLDAPVLKGDVMGTAALLYKEKTLAVVNLTASRDVFAAGDASLTTSGTDLITNVVDVSEEGRGLSALVIVGVVLACAAAVVAVVFFISPKSKKKRRAARSSNHHVKKYYIYKGGDE